MYDGDLFRYILYMNATSRIILVTLFIAAALILVLSAAEMDLQSVFPPLALWFIVACAILLERIRESRRLLITSAPRSPPS